MTASDEGGQAISRRTRADIVSPVYLSFSFLLASSTKKLCPSFPSHSPFSLLFWLLLIIGGWVAPPPFH